MTWGKKWKWYGEKKWKGRGKEMEMTLKEKNHLIFKEGLEEFTGWTLSRAEVSCPWNMVTSFGSLIKQQCRTGLERSIRKVGASGGEGGSQAEGVWPLTSKQMTSDCHPASTLTCSPRLSMKCIFLARVPYQCPLCVPEGSSPVHKRDEWPQRRVRMFHRRGTKVR